MPAPVEARLGTIEHVYHVRRALRRSRLTAAVVLGALAFAAWVVAAYRGLIAYTEYGPLLVTRWVGLPLAVGIVLAVPGIWLGIRAWRTSRLRVRLHTNGLAVVRGRRGRALTWPDIRSLWSRAERTGLPRLAGARRLRLELEASDGRKLVLDDSLEDFEILAESIKARTYALLLAQYTHAFNEHRPLAFGPIRLSPAGIEDGPRPAFEWKEIRGAQLADGRLRIETTRAGKQSSISIPAHQVPNVEICAQIIQEIGQTA